ncbi:MAG TPA: tol-pal system-associated acyl-CoA thioesterase [Burkholderiales bacterium]|nr:tol-pal system-associated acyl-CoA thioesterase [Burkholderiales bacterium]
MRPKRPSEHPSPVTRHSSPLFSWRVRVYYEDTDSGGVVYYANYLKFLERARTEWLRALGFELDGLARDHGAIFIVRSLAIEYLRPAAFNDEIAATVELGEVGGGQIFLTQRITRGTEELATAQVRLACVNTATFRPVRIPPPVAARIGKRA